MNNTILLASASQSRRLLLDVSHIKYRVINQHFDELSVDYQQSLSRIAHDIAQGKMRSIELPENLDTTKSILILTADTISQDGHGVIHSKPIDKADAIEKIKLARDGVYLCTAFCLERREWNGMEWDTKYTTTQVIESRFIFDVPDHCIEKYLTVTNCLQANGALVVENYGMQFLKEVRGSYSTILGLPLFELRQALEKFGFF